MRQNPEDVDPERYAEEGDLTELPEIPRREPERVYMQAERGVPVPEVHLEQKIEVDQPETPEEIAKREGIHERIQAE